jgi:hypothetical protein
MSKKGNQKILLLDKNYNNIGKQINLPNPSKGGAIAPGLYYSKSIEL